MAGIGGIGGVAVMESEISKGVASSVCVAGDERSDMQVGGVISIPIPDPSESRT